MLIEPSPVVIYIVVIFFFIIALGLPLSECCCNIKSKRYTLLSNQNSENDQNSEN